MADWTDGTTATGAWSSGGVTGQGWRNGRENYFGDTGLFFGLDGLYFGYEKLPETTGQYSSGATAIGGWSSETPASGTWN